MAAAGAVAVAAGEAAGSEADGVEGLTPADEGSGAAAGEADGAAAGAFCASAGDASGSAIREQRGKGGGRSAMAAPNAAARARPRCAVSDMHLIRPVFADRVSSASPVTHDDAGEVWRRNVIM